MHIPNLVLYIFSFESETMKKIKILFEIIGIILVVYLVISQLSTLVERKASYIKYAEFYSQEEDFDVLFMGTSHVINAIHPMELWDEYGIVSYNFGGHSNTIPTTYWIMQNALDYTQPKLIVIDCYLVGDNNRTADIGYQHMSFDSMPLSWTKIRAVNDLFEGDSRGFELLWNFSVYHNRWSELEQIDYEPALLLNKGAEYRINVAVPNEISEYKGKKMAETLGSEYLCRIIEECQNRNIDVLLTYLPFPATEEEQNEAQMVCEIANKYHIDYINFLQLDLVNYSTDCWDPNSHLNPSGARKVTTFLGNYIVDNYDISDQRDNQEYSRWHYEYGHYEKSIFHLFSLQKEVENYLLLMKNRKIDFTIKIKGDSEILKDARILALLSNLGIHMEAEVNTNQMLAIQKKNGSVNVVIQSDNGNDSDIDILIMDSASGDMIDSAKFMWGNGISVRMEE